MHHLDFTRLPTIDKMSIFTGMDPQIVDHMAARGFLRETLDRARGAVMLFHATPRTSESWHSGAYIRGGLAEFRSIEDALQRDLKAAAIHQQPHTLLSSSNPLLHLMHILRNIEIHTAPAVIRSSKAMVRYPGPQGQEVPLPIVVIDDLTAGRLMGKREVKREYYQGDLERMVSWFTERQFDFGAQHLLALGVELFAREILDHTL